MPRTKPLHRSLKMSHQITSMKPVSSSILIALFFNSYFAKQLFPLSSAIFMQLNSALVLCRWLCTFKSMQLKGFEKQNTEDILSEFCSRHKQSQDWQIEAPFANLARHEHRVRFKGLIGQPGCCSMLLLNLFFISFLHAVS
jgi:hypothetical protein